MNMANPSTHYSLAAEIRSLAERGMVLYSQSYAKMRENELAIEYAVAEGRAEGRAEERHKAIKAMFENWVYR